MSSYKPNEMRKDEFRRYLERSGVLDGLTKVLVSLYEEPDKPGDALEYIRKHLAGPDDSPTECEILEKRLELVEAENRELRAKLAKLDLEE